MSEIPVLEELKNVIREKVNSQDPDFIKTDLLKQLDKTLEEAIKHIKDSKNFY